MLSWIALLFSLVLSTLLPFLPFSFFIPPLIWCLQTTPSLYFLFLLISGVLLDCFSWSLPFGVHLISYLCTGWLIQKRLRWLQTNAFAFGAKVCLFCGLETLLRFSLLLLLQTAPPLSFRWLLSHLLLMPLLNALYGVLFFAAFQGF